MRLVFLLALMTCSIFSTAQIIDWQKSKDWKLYDIKNNKPFAIPVDSLRTFNTILLDDIKMKSFLHNASIIPKDNEPVWMGAFLLTYAIDGQATQKVEVSVYGGFLFDEKTKTHYQLPEAVKAEFLSYITEQEKVLQTSNENHR